jgi:hypothetical protein
MILAISVTVMLVDMSIKASILEQANALRLDIEGARNDRFNRTSDPMDRTRVNGHHSVDVPLDVHTRMETGIPDISSESLPKNTRPRRTKPKSTGDSGEV